MRARIAVDREYTHYWTAKRKIRISSSLYKVQQLIYLRDKFNFIMSFCELLIYSVTSHVKPDNSRNLHFYNATMTEFLQKYNDHFGWKCFDSLNMINFFLLKKTFMIRNRFEDDRMSILFKIKFSVTEIDVPRRWRETIKIWTQVCRSKKRNKYLITTYKIETIKW